MPLGFRATSPAVIVPRAMIPRGATRNRFGAASVIVGELRGFRSWSPLSGESRLVRNSWERLRPSNKAAPDPTPPQDCPPLRPTKGDLPRRFSRGLSSEFAKKRSDVLLPWCEESRDSKSRTHWGRRNELDRNCEAPPVEGLGNGWNGSGRRRGNLRPIRQSRGTRTFRSSVQFLSQTNQCISDLRAEPPHETEIFNER